MRKQIKTALILILGWSFLLLGVVGLFMPILQGMFFILLGLYLLAKRSKLARDLVERLYHRYPRIANRLTEAQRKGESLIRKGKAIFQKEKR